MNRPWYVGLIGWLSIVLGVLPMATWSLVAVLLVANGSNTAINQGLSPLSLFHMPLSAYFGLAIIVSTVIFIDGIFLLKARNWARQLAVVLWVLGMASNIYAYGINVLTLVQVVFAASVVFALNTTASIAYFLHRISG